MTQIDDEAVNTMALLDTQVRNKIRAELLDIIRNPRNDEERALLDEVARAHDTRRWREREREREYARIYQATAAEQWEAHRQAARAQNYAAAMGMLAEDGEPKPKPKPKPKSSWGFW